MRSIRMSTRKVTKIRDRIYGEEHGLDRVCATRHQTTIFLYFFDTTRHKETWVGLAVKPWGSTRCVCVNSSVKHTRARNTKTST
jgi:hypothetical protein